MAGERKPNPIDIHVGGRVRFRRMMIGLSQEKLGDHLGVTFQQIQKYEKGMNRIGASRLQNISCVLDVPVSFFFDGAPGPDGAGSQNGLEENSATFMIDFLSSGEGLQLNKAFSRIKNAKVRRRVVDLVRTLADDEE